MRWYAITLLLTGCVGNEVCGQQNWVKQVAEPSPPVVQAQAQLPSAPLAPSSTILEPTGGPAPVDANKAAIRREIRDYLAEVEAQRQADAEGKKKEADEKGHEVGSDLNLQA